MERVAAATVRRVDEAALAALIDANAHVVVYRGSADATAGFTI
jgi:hypothetical protein